MKRRGLALAIGLLCCLSIRNTAIAAQDPPAISESAVPAGIPATPAVLAKIVPPSPCSAPYANGIAYDSIHQTMWVAVSPAWGPGFVCEFGLVAPYPLITFVANVINPRGLDFDATTGYLWATNIYSSPGVFVNTVTVIDTAGAGAIVNVLPAGNHPAGDCYFAGQIYAMDFGPPAGPWNFTGFLNNAPWTATTYAAAGNNPQACVAVGGDLWLTLEFSNAVEKVAPPAPGTTFGVGSLPWGITYDGTSVWVANQGSSSVEALNPATGAARNTLALPAGSGPRSLVFGTVAGVNYVWAVDEATGKLTQIKTSAAFPWGTITGTSAAFGNAPQFDAFDPINNHIWVTSTNSGWIDVLN